MEKAIRAPIVCILGHVDHGKTTLLDAIRKTNVASREAGGITQSIGASVVITKEEKKITFIDTPGHAAFSKMRSRGAEVADIIILVVDASDGVKPQTKEALQLIKQSELPFIVAVTKVDLPSADIEGVKGQLGKEGVLFEGRGGDTPAVSVSVKEGKGITELLETITLVWETHYISEGSNPPFEALIIESAVDKRGNFASVVVRNGVIKVGDQLSAEGMLCKVRALFNNKLESVKEIHAGEPAQILGFEKIPPVGARVTVGISSVEQETKVEKDLAVAKGEIPIVIKAKDTGSIEALEGSIPSGFKVVLKGIGDVNESDVLSAKAVGAVIFAFGSRISGSVARLAETEGIKIESFDIIYEIVERLEEILIKGKLEVLGKAEIIATFPLNDKKVAGCKVISGKITTKDNLILTRGEKEIGKTKAISMKKEKNEVFEVKAGEEFGVLFEPQLDFSKGDVLVSVAK